VEFKTPLACVALARSGAIRVPLRPLTWARAFGPAPRHRRAADSKKYGLPKSNSGDSIQT